MNARAEIFEDTAKAANQLGIGSAIGDIAAGAWSKFSATMSYAKDALNVARSAPYIERMQPENEIVNAVRKTIGHKQLLVEEGTRHLDMRQITTPMGEDNFAFDRLRTDAVGAGHSDSLPLANPGNEWVQPTSMAGQELIWQSHGLQSFAHAVEEGAKDGRYSTIVADDVSGRIPALFVHDRLQRYADLHGTEPPRLIFMAGGFRGVGGPGNSSARYRNMMQRIESEGDDLKKGRALLVTEIIASGNSVRQFSKAFEKTGVKFDIAAMSAPQEDELRSILNKDDFNLLQSGRGGGGLYAGGAGAHNTFRTAIGVEKYRLEATARRTGLRVEATHKLREELYELGRYSFEKTH